MSPQPPEFTVDHLPRDDFRCAISQFVDIQGDYLNPGISDRHIRGAGHDEQCRTDMFRAVQNSQPAVSPQKL